MKEKKRVAGRVTTRTPLARELIWDRLSKRREELKLS